jgi:hypothetical protein
MTRKGIRIYVPQDTTARSLGADSVAQAIVDAAADRNTEIDLVRNGSRGLYWLEPLVEVEINGVRTAYGPVAPGDVAGLFDAGFLEGREHALAQGDTKQIPWLHRQERLTFARVGVTDPLSLDDYRAHGGLPRCRAARLSRKSPNPDYVAAAARHFRRASSGTRYCRQKGTRSTSSATRMRVTQVRLPIA